MPPTRAAGSGRTATPFHARPTRNLMRVESREQVGVRVITGTSFGTMPMPARLDAASARAGLSTPGWKRLAFLASLPCRKGAR